MDTDLPQTFLAMCVCNKIFTDLVHLSRHQKVCTSGKKRLAGALAIAKEVYHCKRMHTQVVDSSVDLEGAPGITSTIGSKSYEVSNIQ